MTFDIAQVAKLTGLSIATVYKATYNGSLATEYNQSLGYMKTVVTVNALSRWLDFRSKKKHWKRQPLSWDTVEERILESRGAHPSFQVEPTRYESHDPEFVRSFMDWAGSSESLSA